MQDKKPHEDRISFDLSKHFIHPNILILDMSHGVQCLFLESASSAANKPSAEDLPAEASEAIIAEEPSSFSRESPSEDQSARSLSSRDATPIMLQGRNEQCLPHPSNTTPTQEYNTLLGLKGGERKNSAEGFDDQADKWDLPASPGALQLSWKRPQQQVVGNHPAQLTHSLKDYESLAARHSSVSAQASGPRVFVHAA